MKAKTAEHAAGSLFTLAEHHPVGALIAAGIVVVVLWVAKRVMFGQSGPAPSGEATVVSHDGFAVGIILAGVLGWVLIGSSSTPAPAKAKAAPRPVPRVTHTTIVQHITHVTEHASAGNGGWVVAGIAVVAVLGFVAFLNRRIGS